MSYHARFSFWCLLFLLPGSGALSAAETPSNAPLAKELNSGQALVTALPLEELMGPLAPVALSPFFGLACLSGSALLAEQGLLPANRFMTEHKVLGRGDVFIVFLILSLVTSLPRLTKTGKLFTQMADQAETYAGIVAYAVLLFLAPTGGGGQGSEQVVVTAGVFSAPLEVVLMVTAALNILVVTTVRGFFELLIWLSPIPLVDALFETCNKAVCLVLAAIYAFSPWAAFVINLFIFLVCLGLFKWARAKLVYLKHKTLVPLWRKIFPKKSIPESVEVP